MITGESTISAAEMQAIRLNYRWDVRWLLGDVNRRDRRHLLAELDRMLSELPPKTRPRSGLGNPEEIALTLRRTANLPRRVSLRRRFWRSPWWVKAATVIVVAMIAPLTWYGRTTLQYELQTTGYAGQDGVETVTAGDVHEARYQGVPGGAFRYGMYVYNPGPYSVEITDVDRMRDWLGDIKVDSIRVAPGSGAPGQPWLDSTEFVAFTLRPGDERLIWITGHFADCGLPTPWSSGYRQTGKTWVETWPITFRVLGVTRHQDLPLSTHFAVVGSRAGSDMCWERL